MKPNIYYAAQIKRTLFANDDQHCKLSHFLSVRKAFFFSPQQVSAAVTPSSSSVNRAKGTAHHSHPFQ